MSEATLPIKLEPLLAQIQEAVPKLQRGRDIAVEKMTEIQAITSDEDLEAANHLLVQVRNTYDKMVAMRMPITKQTDELKELLMQYEKELDQNGKNNNVIRIRSLIGKYNQEKIDASKKAAEEARKQKERENYKVELTTKMRQKLSDLLIERVSQVNSGSAEYFKASTLENWDARANQFRSFKPTLKVETYTACFEIPFDKDKITSEEFDLLFKKMQAEEPYDKWNKLVMDQVLPVINDWIGRIPDLKQQLIEMNAADEEEKARLTAIREKEEKEAEERQKAQVEAMKKKQEDEIKQREEIDRMGNEFQEQAAIQQTEDVGPVKLILRFKDDKPVKALCEIIYQCFLNPKFPGIQKKNRAGELLVDEHGFPVYVDGVDFWLSFFTKYGKTEIDGIERKEVSKVIVRK